MEDIETGSLWSHHLGRAMEGELKGEELRTLPAVMLTWREWRELHPGTSVLAMSRTAKRFLKGVWEDPERFVYVLPGRPGQPAPALDLALLQKQGVVVVTIDGVPVLVTHAADGTGVQAFESRAAGRDLAFEAGPDGGLVDRQTRSRWNRSSGVCETGELKGRRLPSRFGMISFRAAWEAFHEGGKLLGNADDGK